jgi:phosphoribosylformimino-5-aminoimidazole carboxamide ribonucleotide (ProFAR) isomerase
MLRIVKIWFLVFSLAALTSACAPSLTEESAKQVISKIDNAVNTLNAQEVANALSDDVELILNINVQGQIQVLRPSKQEYIAMLQQGWAKSTNYEYSRSNMEIKIQGNKAFVSTNVKESMTVQGQNISGESKEEVTIELINGSPLITKVIGYTSM